ncbi:hypothetical protein KAR91_23825 [Candidatus Pacearchaeota archaeon]|nr:hypothetical protein [Candidatus Pacearchaeota archaeon]
MAFTETEICNMALGHIGVPALTVFGESTPQGRACTKYYAAARDFVLRGHAWGFAEYRNYGALLTGQTLFGWDLAYQYPNDSIHMRRLWQEDETLPPIQFQVMLSANKISKIIVTNEAQAVLVYTLRLTNTASYDIAFVTALSWKLASDLAIPLTKKKGKTEELLRLYQAYIASAKDADVDEESVDRDPESDFITARK